MLYTDQLLIICRGSAGEMHTEETAEYANALPLILGEHESINFFSHFKITIRANTKLIDKFIDKLSEDK